MYVITSTHVFEQNEKYIEQVVWCPVMQMFRWLLVSSLRTHLSTNFGSYGWKQGWMSSGFLHHFIKLTTWRWRQRHFIPWNVFNLCLLDCAKIDQLDVTCCWALKNEIIKQVTSSWSIFIQLSLTIQIYQLTLHNDLNHQQHSCESLKYCKFKLFLIAEHFFLPPESYTCKMWVCKLQLTMLPWAGNQKC